jgi:predicted dehydrogenase
MRAAPVEIKAVGEIGATGVDESTSVVLKYPSGALGMVNCTVNAPVESRAEIIGTNGKIIIPRSFIAAQSVVLHMENKEPVEIELPFDNQAGFQFEIDAASESYKKGRTENEIMPLSDTIQLMETIDEIKRQLGLVYANDR